MTQRDREVGRGVKLYVTPDQFDWFKQWESREGLRTSGELVRELRGAISVLALEGRLLGIRGDELITLIGTGCAPEVELIVEYNNP